MPLAYASISETGLKHRENEDRCLCSPDLRLFAVADGMSGAAGGAVASDLAVRALEEYIKMAIEESPSTVMFELMREAFLAVNFTVFQTSLRRPELIGMGTTLTAAVVGNGFVTIGHVGDSRCYLVRGDELRQITSDHVITPMQTKPASRYSRILSQCVGFEEEVTVDTLNCPVVAGDTLVLCSDGISDFLNENDVKLTIQGSGGDSVSWESAARRLVRLAKLRGSDDDTSVIIFQPEQIASR